MYIFIFTHLYMTYTLEGGSRDSDSSGHLTGEEAGDKVALLGIAPPGSRVLEDAPHFRSFGAPESPHPLAKEASGFLLGITKSTN